jgi:hypothetical protein
MQRVSDRLLFFCLFCEIDSDALPCGNNASYVGWFDGIGLGHYRGVDDDMEPL